MQHQPQPDCRSLYDDYFVRQLVPDDHPLLEIDRAVDFCFVREVVSDLYSPERGRRAVDPALLLRLCFLQAYYDLSDREVIERARSDVACRCFLHLGLEDALPDASTLSVFRSRLGAERFKQIFNYSVGMAVERGLVQGRLVLVDSYGVVADMAIPRMRRLLMRVVDRGLRLLEMLGVEASELEAERGALSKDNSWGMSKQLREQDLARWFVLCGQVRAALAGAQVSYEQDKQRAQMVKLLDGALARGEPQQKGARGDRLAGDVDADARWSVRERGKKAFVGYKEQIVIDADSEIITGAGLTPANEDDSTALLDLLDEHKRNVGGDPEGLAGDSGYASGSNRAELQEREIDDFLAPPTPKGHKRGMFSATDFAPEFDHDGTPLRVRCPAGQVAAGGSWQEDKCGWNFYFSKAQCAGCPLRMRCSKSKRGRTLFISPHWQLTKRALERVETPQFVAAQVARLGIERQFAHQQRRCGLKRTRYRGLDRVAAQVFVTCFTLNVLKLTKAARSGVGVKRKRAS
jgi:IS5 family transposase